MDNPEIKWLRLASQGNEEAFTYLVDMYQNPVYNLCYRMLGNETEAEDAAQETFWRAFQGLKKYDPTRSFATWLLSIAAHYCIDQQRRRKLNIVDLEALPEDSVQGNSEEPEKAVSSKEDRQQIHELLNSLNPQDRAAVIMRYWYDFSDEEISTSLSLSVSAVKSRLFRARQQLAKNWQVKSKDPAHKGGRQHEPLTL